MISPNVSLCIPAYSEVEYLQKAIQSCLSQSYRLFEIIVSDDTPNQSVEIMVKRLAAQDSRIQYIRNPGKHGAAANSNYAARQTSGEWIKFLCQDDLFDDQNSLAAFVNEASR